jgi:predicted lipid-binding transport protein (Tim44 family)
MNPETRAFLDAVRTAEDPSPDDARRVLSSVRAALVAGAAVGAGIGSSKAAAPAGGGVVAGLKLGGVIIGLGAAAWVAGAIVRTDRPAPRAAAASAAASVRSHSPAVASAAPPSRQEDAKPPVTISSIDGLASPSRPARRGAEVGATAAPLGPPSLRDEIALLAEVQGALERGDGATALRRLDERAAVDRRLIAERRAARILTLCLLDRTEEAKQAALVFFREHPTSVQRTAVERSCAGNVMVER